MATVEADNHMIQRDGFGAEGGNFVPRRPVGKEATGPEAEVQEDMTGNGRIRW